MAIPIAYNLRNLIVRKTTTVMTALGIGLTVAVLVADLALVEGLRSAFKASGHPLQLIVMRKGSNAELNSSVTREALQILKVKPGLAVNSAGEAMASPEILGVINLPSVDSPLGMNLTVRGVSPIGVEMRDLKLQQGRWFQSGRREIVVGKSVAKRYPNAQLGKRVRWGKGDWDVVGVFDAGESAINGEIWGDVNQVGSDYNRLDTVSSVLVRASDSATVQALINSLEDDRQLGVNAVREREYYDQQTVVGAPLQFFGMLVAVIMAVGSSFAAMNTMYAAVSRRAKEIGTLRVLGFSRGSILFSFLLESLLLAFIGGVLGCLLALPINGVTTGIGSFSTFSEIAFNFRVSPSAMLAGIIFALVVGAIGGLFPAGSAARKEILTALREI
ncbi:MAG TPA: ABC transporter permease [Blastocatellia bacterium]|jgi:ABC-type antimicrobial peptide transport system permease subunit